MWTSVAPLLHTIVYVCVYTSLFLVFCRFLFNRPILIRFWYSFEPFLLNLKANGA